MNDRLKTLRKELNFTQAEFGKHIGMSRDAIAGYERGVNISEPTIRLICKVFNVNYLWLTEGIGDMFNAFPQTILDELVEEFNLDETDRIILESYLEAPEDQRKALSNFFQTFAKKAQKRRED